MSDIDNSNSPPAPEAGKRRRFGWGRAAVMAGLLLGGIGIGAGGLAVAATMPGHAGWHGGPPLDMIQRLVLRQLDAVGATTAQEAKVHDIIATAFSGMEKNAGSMEAVHKQALDLLRAPTIDRAAAEKLRADQIAALDAKSKTLVAAVLDIADQLTPEQRAKLAERAETMAQHGPWGGPHGPGGWQGGPPMGGEHGRGFWQHQGPDGGPDKN
jgi:protein CpxP